jgi:hypothetical protein
VPDPYHYEGKRVVAGGATGVGAAGTVALRRRGTFPAAARRRMGDLSSAE